MCERILIVDDNRDLAENLAELLADEGYATTTAASGEAALNLSVGSIFDLVLSDVCMPGITGVELVLRLRPRLPEPVFFLMTAFPSEVLRREAISAGVQVIFDKPVDLTDLLRRVARVPTLAGLA
ncbi:MAG: response regulator [Myxococcales bacterium]|nr:response regulator [Myxococcales bacterium]